MTGLERLRDLVDGMAKWSVCSIMEQEWCKRNGISVLNNRSIDNVLFEIANQIERETAHDPSEDVSMSAYDLLPEEDRKAIAWVRENGGVNAVSRGFQDADNRRVELCASLDIDLETGWADAMVAMRRRLMPEGMEWPRFEDGEPVRVGDRLAQMDDGVLIELNDPVDSVTFYGDGMVELHGDMNTLALTHGERVKRPAPKVLDADGVEIRVGDTLYGVKTGESVTVERVEHDNPWFSTAEFGLCHCGYFTHRAPVLAADGKPLREGETVWGIFGDGPLTVREVAFDDDPDDPEHLAWCGESKDDFKMWRIADELTHERPDSWERLEEDAVKRFVDYWDCEQTYCQDCPVEVDGRNPMERFETATCNGAMKRDLVRRAKKLAGVEL